MQTTAWFREKMAAVDAMLRAHTAQPLSLAPHKHEVTRLQDLAAVVMTATQRHDCLLALSGGVAKIVEALIAHFPDNIFWDMDYMVAALGRLEQPSHVTESCQKIADLLRRFGVHSRIHFQYAHDFTYGYDWARWVAKQPGERASVPPYGLPFLNYLEKREHELLQLIDHNDTKYHQLPDERPRNPFAFNRTPAAERKLHEVMAERQLVPVRAWEVSPACQWQHDYTRAREEISCELARTGA